MAPAYWFKRGKSEARPSVDLSCLIESLSKQEAYRFPVKEIEVRQTHISVVFLVAGYVYKIKKPVSLGFLDFSTLAQRRHYCELEARLNQRLAPAVYLGVVPISHGKDGRLLVEGQGEPVEWAVKMTRLPASASLVNRLRDGEADPSMVESLARRIADFHASAESGDCISAYGQFDAVARNLRENLDQSVQDLDVTVSRMVFDRLRDRTEEALRNLKPLIDERARRGVPRDGHGDLRLEHVYLFPERRPPHELLVIDCIEFNERFRYLDPVADMAFLAMDFLHHGRRDLARMFTDAYFKATGDDEGRALLPLYIAYRAAVRGKVDGLKRLEFEVPESERAESIERAKGYWLLSLSQLEAPSRKPCLVLVGGLPGSGKSTLARLLSERADFELISSDLTRKALAAESVDVTRKKESQSRPIYTPAWNERTYAACLRRATEWLFEGRRVLVDATFREEARRRAFLDAAARHGVSAVFLTCEVDSDVARQRLLRRPPGPSDADWSVHQRLAACWEESGPLTQSASRAIQTSGSEQQTLSRALEALAQFELWE